MAQRQDTQSLSCGRADSFTLTIRKEDLQTVIDHCIAGLPNEACGILAGKGGKVEKVYLINNARPSPVSFEMDPEEQFRVMKDIRQSGLDLTGIFHSHPDSRAYPSGIDVEKAYWPGTLFPNYPQAVYVIVSLMDRNKPVVGSFSIASGEVSKIPMRIEERIVNTWR